MCDCLDKINEHLEKQGKEDRQKSGIQNYPDGWSLETVVYLTTLEGHLRPALHYGGEKRNGNYKRVGRITANFCPFCGEKYALKAEEEKAA